MEDSAMNISTPAFHPTPAPVAELERLGDEIAELSAHLDAATARLLDLIREFDARAGWNNGFRSCAAWLSWRVGLDPGAARERVRVARALGTLPRLARALAHGELSYAKVRALTRVSLLTLRSGSSPSARPAPPSTSSASCEAGGAWTGRPRPRRPRTATGAEHCTCITTETAWSSCAGGWRRRSARCSCRRSRRRGRRCISARNPRAPSPVRRRCPRWLSSR